MLPCCFHAARRGLYAKDSFSTKCGWSRSDGWLHLCLVSGRWWLSPSASTRAGASRGTRSPRCLVSRLAPPPTRPPRRQRAAGIALLNALRHTINRLSKHHVEHVIITASIFPSEKIQEPRPMHTSSSHRHNCTHEDTRTSANGARTLQSSSATAGYT